MIVTLTVRQRLDLQGILPSQANFSAIKMIHKVREELSFTDAEHTKIDLKYHTNGSVEWNNKKGKALKDKKVEIPATVCSMLKKSFVLLDKQNKLTEAHVEIYEMFVTSKKKKK